MGKNNIPIINPISFCFIAIFLIIHPIYPMYFSKKLDNDLTRLRQSRDHRILEDKNGYGYVWDLQKAIYSSFHPKFEIPVRNIRQILILSLLRMSPEERAQKSIEIFMYTLNKNPAFQDAEEIRFREIKLLSFGIVAQCQWAIRVPAPFGGTQCTLAELDMLLSELCIDKIFKGLPVCPEIIINNQISVLS